MSTGPTRRAPGGWCRVYFKLFHVQRLGALRLAGSIERDLLDPRFGLPQQVLAAPLEGFAALIDGDRFLKWHLAVFEALDDRLQFLDRPLEAQLVDIGEVFFGQVRLGHGVRCSFHPRIRAVTCAATERDRPWRS